MKKNNHELRTLINILENLLIGKKKSGHSSVDHESKKELDEKIKKLNTNSIALNKNIKRQEELNNLMQLSPIPSFTEEAQTKKKKKLAMEKELDQVERALHDVVKDLNKIQKSKFNFGMLSDEFAVTEKGLKNELKKLNDLIQEYAKVPASEALIDEKTSLPEFKRGINKVIFIESEIMKMLNYVDDLKSTFQKMHNQDPQLANQITSAGNKIDWLSEHLYKAKLEFREKELEKIADFKMMSSWLALKSSGEDPNALIAKGLNLHITEVKNVDKELIEVREEIKKIEQKDKKANLEKVKRKKELVVNKLNTRFGKMMIKFTEIGKEIFDETKKSYMAWKDKPYDLTLLDKLSDQITKEEDQSIDEASAIRKYIKQLRNLIASDNLAKHRIEKQPIGKQRFEVLKDDIEKIEKNLI